MSEPQTATSPPPLAPAHAAVLGTRFTLTDYDGVLDWIDAAVAARHRGYVCVAATHTVMAAREDPELRTAVARSDLTVPDGMPIVWALGLLGHRLADRVYGPDLMWAACARARRTGQRFYLHGGRDDAGAMRALVGALRAAHPGLEIAGASTQPHRDLSEAEEVELAERIDAASPDVVWVGLGVPRQEKWMQRMRPRLAAPVLVGVGAAFDFHAGLVRQAPDWMQRRGLEWLFRLSQEPRRLWRRYLRYNPRFVTGFAAQYVRHLRRRRP